MADFGTVFLLAAIAKGNQRRFLNNEGCPRKKRITTLDSERELQTCGFYTSKLSHNQMNCLDLRTSRLRLPPLFDRENQGSGHVSFVHSRILLAHGSLLMVHGLWFMVDCSWLKESVKEGIEEFFAVRSLNCYPSVP